MFHVVEFHEDAGGGLGIVHSEWLTPRKQETFWPTCKHPSKFQKTLLEGVQPDESWKLFKLKKIYYATG